MKRAHGVRIKPALCLYNPEEVYRALNKNKEIVSWLDYIAKDYRPEPKQILLIYPCSADKPYTISRSYKRLFGTLDSLGEIRNNIHLMSISEPFALVPEEFYDKSTPAMDWSKFWYDCPGLFRWWCRSNGQPYSKEFLEKSIDILSTCVANFLGRVPNTYQHIVALVRTFSSSLQQKDDHTHRRIIEIAANKANVSVDILPSRQIVRRLVSQRGRFSWDMLGVSHPIVQQYLARYLMKHIDDRSSYLAK